MMKHILINAILVVLAFFSASSFSKASLFLTEDVLYLTDDVQITSVDIINRGTRTGVFAVRWLDHIMQPDGSLVKLETGTAEHSLAPKVRFSPRRVTLQPGQSQRIKIAIKRKFKNAPEGEYYSHLNVHTLNDDLESTLAQQNQSERKTEGVQVKARIGISIPVIWRHRVNAATANLKLAEVIDDKARLTIVKIGNASLRGYLHIVNNQSNSALTEPFPVVIYPNLDERELALTIPEKVQDDLSIIFSESNQLSEALSSGAARISLK